MKSICTKKVWSKPTVMSMSNMNSAQGGLGDGTPKGLGAIEAVYDGPGS